MAMAWIWVGMVTASVLYGIPAGTISAVSSAALEGAAAAVELCLSMAGVICLWSGILSMMADCGLTDLLSKLFRPFLCRLLPHACRDRDTLSDLSGNLSCNLLGLGNAATPLGLRAAQRMAKNCNGIASNELCLLVVINTASIQLIPTTVAGVRSALGAASPFDILPAVWLSSVLSLITGILAARLLAKFWK